MLKNGWMFLILLFVVFGCSYKERWEACVIENTSLRTKNKELSARNTKLSNTNASLHIKNNRLHAENKELSAKNTKLSSVNIELEARLKETIKSANVAKVRDIIELAKKISFAQVSDENDARYFSQALKDILDNPDKDLVNVEAGLNNDKPNEALKRLEEEANEVFETRVKIAYLLFGCSHVEQREYDKAKELLDKAIEIDSNFVDALYYRAYVYYEQNDRESANADARQVLKVSKGKHPDPHDLFKSLRLTMER